MERVWCLPLIVALLSLLLHHHNCTGRQVYDGLYKVSPDFLTDRHVGNSKMFRRLFGQIDSPKVGSLQAKAHRQLDTLGEKADHVDFLLTLEAWKQRDIWAKVEVAINEHANAAETSKTAKVDKIANAHTQLSAAKPPLCHYVVLERESKKWDTIESTLTEMEDDLDRVQHAEESLRKRVKGFHEHKDLLKGAQKRLIASVERAVRSNWFKQDVVKQNGEVMDLVLEAMDEEKKDNEALLGRVKDGKELDSETERH